VESKYTQCPRQGVPYLVGDNNDIKKRVIVKARCKQWDCPYCAPINKQEHYNRIAIGLTRLWKNDTQWQFVTITCHEKWRGYNASVKNWRRNKDKLLARFRRKHKKEYDYPCEYVYIPECHKDKTVHIHGLFSGQLESRWWKDNARECGLGFMAESDGLKNVIQGLNYITKYMVKEIGMETVGKNFRRICYSQGFPDIHNSKSAFLWSMLDGKTSIEAAIIEGINDGKSVKFDNRNFDSYDDLLTHS
jgi:hypothetical protein